MKNKFYLTIKSNAGLFFREIKKIISYLHYYLEKNSFKIFENFKKYIKPINSSYLRYSLQIKLTDNLMGSFVVDLSLIIMP